MTLSTHDVTTAGREPMAGLAVQVALLAVLAATVGLTGAGWVAGIAYGVVLTALLARGMRRTGATTLGPANVVTLARSLMIGGVTAMVVSGVQRPVHQVALVTLVGVALALDGVDGQVARRTGTTTALGARFDMEADSFLVLVLSLYVAADFGWWTVLIGAYRYLFVAASWAAPWLSGALPPRFSRKVVAAIQGVVLVTVTAGLLPAVAEVTALAAALAVLTWSFGLDVRWLWRAERTRRRVPAPCGPLPIEARPRQAELAAVS